MRPHPARPIAVLASLATVSVAIAIAIVALRTPASASIVGPGTMELQASGQGVLCDIDVEPTVCNVPLAAKFTLAVAVADMPDGGYRSIATEVQYASLTYNPALVDDEMPFPDAIAVIRNFFAPNRVRHESVPQQGVASMYKGAAVQLSMTCTVAPSSNTVSLLPYDAQDNSDGSVIIDANGAPIAQDDNLTVLCGTDDTLPTPTPISGTIGDVNCSGGINSIDAALVLQFAAALVDSLRCHDGADVNDDGETDSIDAALILQYVAGLIDSLPP